MFVLKLTKQSKFALTVLLEARFVATGFLVGLVVIIKVIPLGKGFKVSGLVMAGSGLL